MGGGGGTLGSGKIKGRFAREEACWTRRRNWRKIQWRGLELWLLRTVQYTECVVRILGSFSVMAWHGNF